MAGMGLYLDLRHDTQVWRGIYEASLMNWLKERVSADSVCLDIGAAEGVMTVLMAALAPRGRVIAVEPSSRGDWIEKNLALNIARPLAPVELLRVCAGARSAKPEGAPEVLSVDDIAARLRLPRVDVIKIDVDGPELEVLDGAVETLGRRPAMCVEAHSHALLAGVLERLTRRGYRCEVVDPPPHEHRPIEYNPMVFAAPAA